MIAVGKTNIPLMATGEQGIKAAYVGTDLVYERPGNWIFIILDAGRQGFVPKETTLPMSTSNGQVFMTKGG